MKLLKIRTFQEDKLLADKQHVTVYYAIGLYDAGKGKQPVVQLSATARKKQLIKGDVSKMPYLEETEHGMTQLSLLAAARSRIMAASPQELAAFRKGSYIQIQDIAR